MGSDDAFVFSSYQRQNVCSLSLNGFRLMEILYMYISIPSSSCSVKTAVSMWIHTFTAVCNNCRFYFLCLQSLYNSFFIDFFSLTVIPQVFLTTAGCHSSFCLSCWCRPSLGLWSLCWKCSWLCHGADDGVIKAGLKRKWSNKQQSVMPVIMNFHPLHILQVTVLRDYGWNAVDKQ